MATWNTFNLRSPFLNFDFCILTSLVIEPLNAQRLFSQHDSLANYQIAKLTNYFNTFLFNHRLTGSSYNFRHA